METPVVHVLVVGIRMTNYLVPNGVFPCMSEGGYYCRGINVTGVWVLLIDAMLPPQLVVKAIILKSLCTSPDLF